jgi:hypothetical protein
MADSTSNIDTISSAQAQKEVTANAALNSASPAMFGARRASTTSALTWGYYGGRWKSVSIANGTVTLTANTTNYIVANRDTGAITLATTTTNWNDEANYMRLNSVVVGTSAVTSYQDHRQPYDNVQRKQVNLVTTGSPSGYIIVDNDLGKILEIDTASAVTLTLPNDMPQGFFCDVVQAGAGVITFSPESGAVLYNRQGHDETAGQWAVTRIYVTKNSGSPAGLTAEWVLSGDTA